MISTGGSSKGLPPVREMENLLRRKPRSNQTGAGNATTEPDVKWVEGVCDGIETTRFLMRYNYHRGSQSML